MTFVFTSFISCNKQEDNLFQLKNDSGFLFKNQLKPNAELNILSYLYYYNGGGVATADFNNDGLLDVYFTGNQVEDKLYLNKGALQFEDVTDKALIQNKYGWTTGVTIVDINNDRLMDIYVCKIGNFAGITGKNLLFVNQGYDEDGIPRFKEEATLYNLAIESFATQAAFFDYDLDGDLDMYLLNHSVYPNSTYGKGAVRNQIDAEAGDKFFLNQDGKYTEISEKAGIFQGRIGYGLGLGVSDVNQDGYPDIYIGNDFFENDYLYINQQNGNFKEVISTNQHHVGHTSHYSMGNDIADLDNDGWPDIVSLDMLPQDLKAYKTSGREYNNQIYDQYLKNGYHPQYMQNTLMRNAEGAYLQEIAFASGISATDWSWGPLIVDLDNDGHKDIFISNGILGATNDMDFINFIADRKIQEQLSQGIQEKDLKFTEQLPERKLSNVFYKNNGDLTFIDVTLDWFSDLPSFSNGCVYADLDNDGDQDLVVNNVNQEAYLLENHSEKLGNHFIQLKFIGSEKNTMGIGAKIKLYADSLYIFQENHSTRGYLSAVAPEMNLGLGKRNTIDSLEVIWPDGSSQKLTSIGIDQKLELNFTNASRPKKEQLNVTYRIPAVSLIDHKHEEPTSYEFGREPLIPYSKGAEGPAISVADIDMDGLQDLYIGGGKNQAGALYLQQPNATFILSDQPAFELQNDREETDNLFFDADLDGDLDLLVVSGGNEYLSGTNIQPLLYHNEKGKYMVQKTFPEIEINASVVKAADLDNDGDLDIVIGANAVPQKFGRSARNYVLYNDGQGNFQELSEEKAKSFSQAGLIEDIVIQDLNDDQLPDIIAVGHWMPISIFINSEQGFILQENNSLAKTNGLWNQIKVYDIDQDGDLDLIAGNWGQNTRFRASFQDPMELFINDFDENGKEEAILTYYDNGVQTVFSSKDELVKQLPLLNKKFLSYADFAKASFNELFEKDKIVTAQKKQVFELSSCIYENIGDGNYSKRELPFLTQTSSIKSIYLTDFNDDGYKDLILAGNDYGISTQLGRLDASHGIILINDTNGNFIIDTDASINIEGQVRDMDEIEIQDKKFIIATINNASPQFLKIKKKND